MPTDNYIIITPIQFSKTDTWDPKRIHGQSIFRANYPLVPFSKVLHETDIEWVDIDNGKEYQILGVHAYGEGVYINHIAKGSEMTMRRYQKSKVNCLFWCKVRTVRGQFGVVYPQFESTFGSSNMKYMEIDTTKIIPQFLELLFQKNALTDYMDTLAIGANSRHFNPSAFLKVKFPLPSIPEQQALLDKYNETINKANTSDYLCQSMSLNILDSICQKMNIGKVNIDSSNDVLHIVQFKNLSNRWEWDRLSEAINKALDNCIFPVKQFGSIVHFENRSWKKAVHPSKTFDYVEIGGINAEDNSISASVVNVSDAPSRATQVIKSGDLIIGTTRPYLQRFALVTDKEDNYVCSSGFQVIAPSSDYDLRYILEIFKIETTIKQFEVLMTGALYPAINTEQLKQVKIPLPPLEIQKEIAYNIEQQKIKIKALREEAESLRQRAKKEFEEAVFGGF